MKMIVLNIVILLVFILQVGGEPKPCPCEYPTVKDVHYDPDKPATHRTDGVGYPLSKDTIKICISQQHQSYLSRMLEVWKDFYQSEVVFLKDPSTVLNHHPTDLLNPTCHVYVNITEQVDWSTRRLCPEQCRPIPVLTMPKEVLDIHDSETKGNSVIPLTSYAITCSLTLQYLQQQRHLYMKKASSIVFPTSWMAYVVYESSVRRYYECYETAALQRYSPPHNISSHHKAKHKPNTHTTTQVPYHHPGVHTSHIHRREVQGVVIWIGTTDRMSMVYEQTNSLRGSSFHDRKAMIPWLATDEIYPCHPSAIKCHGNLKKYGGLFPQSAINFMKPGWGCAQRRPLRALAHVLLFYDAEYIILLDDDTFFNWALFQQHMLSFVRSNMSIDAVYLGEAMGRTGESGHLSTIGMFVGGSGYIIGQKILQRLVQHEVISLGHEYVKYGKYKSFLFDETIDEKKTPLFENDAFRSAKHKEKLGLLQEGVEYSTASCPKYNLSNQMVDSCIYYHQGKKYHNESHDGIATKRTGRSRSKSHSSPYSIPVGSSQQEYPTVSIGVRLIDYCTNLMANDNTCLHSDHSIGRCLLYGAGANPLMTACSHQTPNITKDNRDYVLFHGDQLFFGMCFMAPQCNLAEHVTCHRYQATSDMKAIRTSDSAGHYKRYSSIYNEQDELDSGV